jgi:hypothetical protein
MGQYGLHSFDAGHEQGALCLENGVKIPGSFKRREFLNQVRSY